MPAPQCNADTEGQRYKCFICQHHQRYNGRGSLIDRYSWADYNTVHPCKRCTTSIFGSTDRNQFRFVHQEITAKVT